MHHIYICVSTPSCSNKVASLNEVSGMTCCYHLKAFRVGGRGSSSMAEALQLRKDSITKIFLLLSQCRLHWLCPLR